jgi:peptidase S24-like protein
MIHSDVINKMFKLIVEAKKLKRTTFENTVIVARELGITHQQLQTLIDTNGLIKKDKLPIEKMLLFCKDNSISADWLLFDKGSKFVKGRNLTKPHKINIISDIGLIDSDAINSIGIKHNDSVIAVNVYGNGMTPTIKENSIALVDTDDNELKESGVYLINVCDEHFVRRLSKRFDSGVDLLTDNETHEDSMLDSSKFAIVGRVVGKIEKV